MYSWLRTETKINRRWMYACCRCLKDMLPEGESQEKWICRANGTWSKPIPKCWREYYGTR